MARAVVEPKNGVIDTMLPASRGKLFAVTPEKIAKIEFAAPKTATRGQSFEVSARVLGASGKVIGGSFPLRSDSWPRLDADAKTRARA